LPGRVLWYHWPSICPRKLFNAQFRMAVIFSVVAMKHEVIDSVELANCIMSNSVPVFIALQSQGAAASAQGIPPLSRQGPLGAPNEPRSFCLCFAVPCSSNPPMQKDNNKPLS